MVHGLSAKRALPALVWAGLLAHAVLAQDGVTRSPAVPPAPMLVSRVDPFRKLLAADGAEREKLLASRPEPQREQFRKALRDYDSLPPSEREQRLLNLELRFQLTYLIPLAPDVRTQAMARLPVPRQEMLQERLAFWNQLAPETQKDILANERVMRDYISRIVSVRRPPLPAGVASSSLLQRINQAASSWNSLPESRRTAAEEAFRRIFESGSTEMATGMLSDAELEDMKRVLERFKLLSPAARSACLRSYGKLMELSPEDRQVFLRSAEQWQKMSAPDREVWKNLVKKAPVFPPNPPGLGTPPNPEPTRLRGSK